MLEVNTYIVTEKRQSPTRNWPSGEKNIGKSRNEKNISILHESHAITLLSSIQKILLTMLYLIIENYKYLFL